MLGIREYNNKIKSLKNTRKITGSMKMVSTVKLQKFSRMKQSAVSFAHSVDATVAGFFHNSRTFDYTKPSKKVSVNKALIIFFTADRGLCGRYNSNIFRETLKFYEQLKEQKIEAVFGCSGNKGHAYLLRYKIPCDHFFARTASNADINSAHEISQYCLSKYLSGEVDTVYLIYSQRKGSLSEEPYCEKVLPVESNDTKKQNPQTENSVRSVILESDPEKVFKHISQIKMLSSVYRALIESTESEHSARMTAMETATTNCDKMIQHYLLLRNRARQTAITTELSEIVTGKEALEQG
jgi:F-type H+-transporting ATPase subunit gamma